MNRELPNPRSSRNGVSPCPPFHHLLRLPRLLSLGSLWLFLAASLVATSAPAQAPVKIILDVDLAEDVDDAGALAVLHALADRGEAEILATMVSARNEFVGPCLDAINTWYGRPDLPIGYQRGHQYGYQNTKDAHRETSSKYAEPVAKAFPHDLNRGSDAPDATLVFRKVLSRQPDQSVTIVTVGFLTNLKNLLDSRPDEFSSLDGEALVKQKVKQWVCMGGIFPGGRFPDGNGEYNVMWDTVASARAINDWPTPIVFSGFEIGVRVKVGSCLRETPEANPVRACYQHYNGLQDREAWDLTAVLYAVRGAGDYWTLSDPGFCLMHHRVTHGYNEWIPTAAKQHRYLIEKMKPGDLGKVLEELIAAPPRKNQAAVPATGSSLELSLRQYRADLDAFRQEYGGSRNLPDIPFFQFGMGQRAKFLYKGGALLDALTGREIRRWEGSEALIVPPAYSVLLTLPNGGQVRIREDERAVWIEEGGRRSLLEGTDAPLRLPEFAGHRYASILRVLHHEILINVIGGLPVPNFYVYRKPWYRDGAMMAMCLKETGNLALIRDWIRGLSEPYDRNNAGETEADNLGQALYLLSLVADKRHPLVEKLLKELPKYEVLGPHGRYIKGRSDFAEHPVYQTKWAKFGLRALGLEDPYVIPAVADSYSSLFWMDYRDQHVAGTEAADRGLYPYLGWATDHFLGRKLSPVSNRDYPLTWEIQASQANYDGMEVVHPVFSTQKTSAPHTWHSAEVFLYLLAKS
jgi:inosine-uridine nucleoside N-ribohydrolase